VAAPAAPPMTEPINPDPNPSFRGEEPGAGGGGASRFTGGKEMK
jgi:hypothetical protein